LGAWNLSCHIEFVSVSPMNTLEDVG